MAGVGTNIRHLREAQNMTQGELARQVGITQAMLCYIERGSKNPSLQVGYEIAQALQCKVEDLLAE